MKPSQLSPEERQQYADLYNAACLTPSGELRSTQDAAVELAKLLAQAVTDGKGWAAFEQTDVRNLGARESVKNWTRAKYRHLTSNGRTARGKLRIRTRTSMTRVPQRRADVEEQLVMQWVNKTYDDCASADLRRIISRSNGQIESERQTVRDCYRMLSLLDDTGAATVRDALLLIGKTLSEFLTAEAAS